MPAFTTEEHSPGGVRARPMRSAEVIYNQILDAVMEHRLAPGTRLVEERLATIFLVSRTKIRQVLSHLAHEGVVTLVPNRGAFISRPTVAEAREVFEVRRLIEPALVQGLGKLPDPGNIARLRAHVGKECAARKANNRRAIIRLSGEFHMLIADMAANSILARMMRELASLTCLIITLYDSPAVPACPFDEHSEIIDAIAAGNGAAAAKKMMAHLRHVEGTLNLNVPFGDEIDLAAIFS